MSQTKAQTRGGCGLPKFMEKAVLPLCKLDRIAGGTDLTSSLHAMSCQLWSRQAQLSASFFLGKRSASALGWRQMFRTKSSDGSGVVGPLHGLVRPFSLRSSSLGSQTRLWACVWLISFRSDMNMRGKYGGLGCLAMTAILLNHHLCF